MVNRCIVCEEVISNSNDSEEHIIPNSIGGRLKTKGFICSECNSQSGTRWDAALSKQLNPMCLFFRIKRERGKPPSQIFTTDDGKEILLHHDGSFTFSKPSIEEEVSGTKLTIRIQARTVSEYKKTLRGLKRKYPKIDIEGMEKEASLLTYYNEAPVNLNLSLGGEEAGRSLVKTSLAFAYLSGVDPFECQVARDYLTDKESEACFGYYYENDPVIDRPDGKVIHILSICGQPETKLLLGYIEYFGIQRIVICLSDSYTGDYFSETYAYDIITREEVGLDVSLSTTPDDLKRICDYGKVPIAKFKEAFGLIMPVGIKNNFEKEKERVINEAVKHAFQNCGAEYGEVLTPEQFKALQGLIWEKLQPFILHNMKRPDVNE